MIKTLKDSYKINLLLAALFLLGILSSIYTLYRLPHNLEIPFSFSSEFLHVYLIITVTLTIGALALTQALRYRKELIVYRDRTKESSQADRDASDERKNSINADQIKSALRTAKGEKEILENGMQAMCKELDAGQGAAYRVRQENDTRFVELESGYALTLDENASTRFNFGEGLIGQAAANGKMLYLDDVPEGYIKIISGLGSASPRFLLITPVKSQDTVLGVLEIASFTPLTADHRKFVEEAAQMIAEKLSTK
jgi:methyl-accepting chemotaxis protein